MGAYQRRGRVTPLCFEEGAGLSITTTDDDSVTHTGRSVSAAQPAKQGIYLRLLCIHTDGTKRHLWFDSCTNKIYMQFTHVHLENINFIHFSAGE